eukprot:529726-Rhodomonas_salina.3
MLLSGRYICTQPHYPGTRVPGYPGTPGSAERILGDQGSHVIGALSETGKKRKLEHPIPSAK